MSHFGKPRPQQWSDDFHLLKSLDPNWDDPREKEIHDENQVYEEENIKTRMREGIADELYGTAEGKGGYLRAPNSRRGTGADSARYLSAPNPPPPHAVGGWVQIPLMMLANMLPELIPAIYKKIKGQGACAGGYAMMSRHPNLSSVGGFYKDIVSQAVGSGMSLQQVKEKMSKLFGGVNHYKKILNDKVGQTVQDPLLMGHLLTPLLHAHLTNALRGTGINVDAMMDHIEEKYPEILDREVTPQNMARGGSIVGTLWTTIKGILSKLLPSLTGMFGQAVGNKGVKKAVGQLINKGVPQVANIGLNKLTKYINQKLKGNEPNIIHKTMPEESEEESENEPTVFKKEIPNEPFVKQKGNKTKPDPGPFVKQMTYNIRPESEPRSNIGSGRKKKTGRGWSVKLTQE